LDSDDPYRDIGFAGSFFGFAPDAEPASPLPPAELAAAPVPRIS
jgi:hypothetical protein